MQRKSIVSKAKSSRHQLMKQVDLNGLKFYLFLPTFNVEYRKKLCRRITEYGGQITLTPKAGNQFVIVSDNVLGYAVERNNMKQLREMYGHNTSGIIPDKENKASNSNHVQRTKQMIMEGQHALSDKRLFKTFMQEQRDSEKNEK